MCFTSWSPCYPISIVRCSVSFPFSHVYLYTHFCLYMFVYSYTHSFEYYENAILLNSIVYTFICGVNYYLVSIVYLFSLEK